MIEFMAAKVEPPAPIFKKVKFPHITTAIPVGGKPFNSNKIPQENFQPCHNQLQSQEQ